MFFSDMLTQAEAAEACERMSAELLSIDNEDEQNFLDTTLSYDYIDYWMLGKKNESK
jgi:hypothetical protein